MASTARLLVLRHGKAHADAPSGLDRDRPLTDRGVAQAEYVGTLLRDDAQAPRIDAIVTSPAERAATTARIVAGVLGMELTVDDRLMVDVPASSALSVASAAAEAARADGAATPRVIIVGHNPTLADVIGLVLHGPSGLPPRLRTGEAIELTFDPARPIGSGRLVQQFRLPKD